MAEISQYNYIEQFALLQDTRNDIRNKPWAKPLYREVFRLRNRIARAKEEILRCNVETRRLRTSIYDQDALYDSVLKKLKSDASPLYGPVHDFVIRRSRVNEALLKRIHQIQDLPGFTGDESLGARVGCTDTRMLPSDTAALRNRDGDGGVSRETEDDGSDGSDDDIEHDDGFQDAEVGMGNFIDTVSLQS